MTLKEAIDHCREKAGELERCGCDGCAADHRQLAQWLEELEGLRKKLGEPLEEAGSQRQKMA
jgi:hypothetical protein